MSSFILVKIYKNILHVNTIYICDPKWCFTKTWKTMIFWNFSDLAIETDTSKKGYPTALQDRIVWMCIFVDWGRAPMAGRLYPIMLSMFHLKRSPQPSLVFEPTCSSHGHLKWKLLHRNKLVFVTTNIKRDNSLILYFVHAVHRTRRVHCTYVCCNLLMSNRVKIYCILFNY